VIGKNTIHLNFVVDFFEPGIGILMKHCCVAHLYIGK